MDKNPKIRVLIVDDHPVVVDGLAAILGRQKEMTVVGTASDGRSAINMFHQLSPDVVLMDLRMPELGGVEAIQEIRQLDPHARVLVLTTYADDEAVFQALKAGAQGYLLKDCPREQLVDSIRAIYDHRSVIPANIASKLAARSLRPELSGRERQVLQLLANGKTNKEIAAHLMISEVTVKTHVGHVMEKLGASNRTDAMRLGVELGLVHMD